MQAPSKGLPLPHEAHGPPMPHHIHPPLGCWWGLQLLQPPPPICTAAARGAWQPLAEAWTLHCSQPTPAGTGMQHHQSVRVLATRCMMDTILSTACSCRARTHVTRHGTAGAWAPHQPRPICSNEAPVWISHLLQQGGYLLERTAEGPLACKFVQQLLHERYWRDCPAEGALT